MLVETANKPTLTRAMLQPSRRGGLLVVRALKEFFGSEDYDLFLAAGKAQEYIPEEDRIRVDRRVYSFVKDIVGSERRSGEGLWRQAVELADRTVSKARLTLFADQDRTATLTTNLEWEDKRPSSALETLTTPTKFIGEQWKYEQARQLAFALLSAEVISDDEGYERILKGINKVMEEQFFIDRRRGDPQPYHVFSYHAPYTNRLVGLSHQYPDSRFDEGLWVKSLDFPVRTVGLRSAGYGPSSIQALYDPRKKEIESAVIKAIHRSLKDNNAQSNGGLIEATPYVEDRLGVRFVLMEGGTQLIDKMTTQLENLFIAMENVNNIIEDDKVDPANGHAERVQFRRRQVYIEGLRRPFEVIVQTLPEYIAYQYEVGNFDVKLGMHNGQAWELYKLGVVSKIAPDIWSPTIFKRIDPRNFGRKVPINLNDFKKAASYEFATRLGRKQRIQPSPYEDSVALV